VEGSPLFPALLLLGFRKIERWTETRVRAVCPLETFPYD
jgi:hypothetical protein